MCEIVLCVKDRGKSGQLGLDCKRPKQGDVIEVRENGFTWCAAALGQSIHEEDGTKHSIFRLIKLPNVTVNQGLTLMQPETDVDPLNPSPYLQFRAKYIDKVKVQANFPQMAAYLLDDLRTNPSITLNATAAQINTCVSTRAPIPF